MATQIGIIKDVTGVVFAKSPDGTIRELTVNSIVFKDDTIIGIATIQMDDGSLIFSETETLLDENVFGVTFQTAVDSAVQGATVDEVIQALDRGEDLSTALDATAAGLGSGGEGGGSSFVQLMRISENVTGNRYAYGYNPLGIPEITEGTFAPTTSNETTPNTQPPVEVANVSVTPTPDVADDVSVETNPPVVEEPEEEDSQTPVPPDGDIPDTPEEPEVPVIPDTPVIPEDEPDEDVIVPIPDPEPEPESPQEPEPDEETPPEVEEPVDPEEEEGEDEEPGDDTDPDTEEPDPEVDPDDNSDPEPEDPTPDVPDEDTGKGPQGNNGKGNGIDDAPGNSGDTKGDDADGSNTPGTIDTDVEDVIPMPVDSDKGPKGNNGWGNGDQDAPGNSLDNNNAENSDATNPLDTRDLFNAPGKSGGNGKSEYTELLFGLNGTSMSDLFKNNGHGSD